MRIEPLDDFAVEFHDQAQHAVRGWVLRPEIDRVVLDRDVAGGRILGVGHSQHLVELINHNKSPSSPRKRGPSSRAQGLAQRLGDGFPLSRE